MFSIVLHFVVVSVVAPAVRSGKSSKWFSVGQETKDPAIHEPVNNFSIALTYGGMPLEILRFTDIF